jgi:hypothetical protein
LSANRHMRINVKYQLSESFLRDCRENNAPTLAMRAMGSEVRLPR